MKGLRKYTMEMLSEDAIGYVYIYKHSYNNSYVIAFCPTLSKVIDSTNVLFDRREMTITPTSQHTGTGIKLSQSAGQLRFSHTPSIYQPDLEQFHGDYEVVKEDGHFKLYKIENQDNERTPNPRQG